MAIDKSQRVGITEAGEISFNLEAFDNLYDANIIITKRLTDNLIDKLVENSNKCILHLTVTGFGGSKIEPFTPSVVGVYQTVLSCHVVKLLLCLIIFLHCFMIIQMILS